MKTVHLFFATALLCCMEVQAQMTDVTSQYIPNADFEECEALPTVVYHDNQKNVDINKIEVWTHWNTAKGTDYEANGWKLVEQMKNANGGVVTYGVNIQSGQYATAGEPGPATGITGQKGLCFTGAAGLIYQQTNEITLPAGVYRLTVNLYARNGQNTNPGPTQQVVNVKTGFMPTGGTEDDLIPAKRSSMQFTSNAWDQEVIDIELTEATTGRFQISYGTSYYVVVDDVKLEYQGGVITTSLQNVITKAQALNLELSNSDLTTAIAIAQAFVAEPTTQEDVALQVENLYTAMANALTASADPVNITAAYLENPSFETGKIDPWEWGNKTGSVGSPTNPESLPYIDGENIVEFSASGSNSVKQTISHLPAGYYAIDAKLNQKAFMVLGTSKTLCQGGSNALFLHVSPAIYHATDAADLTVGTEASTGFRVDNFRLYYGKDEASLLAILLESVKTDAGAFLNNVNFDSVTGEERTKLQNAINGTDLNVINEAVNAFYTAKEAYENFAKAKDNATPYNKDNYPYAKAETLELIQNILSLEVTSRSIALEQTTALNNACASVVWENAYCEGVANTDYTEKIVAANATGTTLNTAWTVNNVNILKVASYKARPNREGGTDREVYGTPDSYTSGTSSLQQTITGLPAGTYVVALSAMAATNLPLAIRINNEEKTTFIGTGSASTSGWHEVVFSFDLANGGNVTLRLDEAESSGQKQWYADNFRIYRINNDTQTIEVVSLSDDTISNNAIYDLQGRRVAQPAKGVFIQNGKKVVIK